MQKEVNCNIRSIIKKEKGKETVTAEKFLDHNNRKHVTVYVHAC